MPAKKTICLAMIVKNEAHLIVDTLKHLDKYIKFDFWVINDNGSTDGTQKLIQDFFADKKIPGILDTTPWQDFAYNRTVAFNVAYNKTDYVFVWDADDEIYGDFVLPAELTEDSYKFIFGSGSEFRYSRCQMFNNRQRWCYKGVLHEYADCLEPSKPSFDVLGNYYFVSGRKGDRSKDPQKYLKDAMVLRREIEKPDGDKNPLYNRYMFYCAQSYNSCGMREEAIEFYKKTLHLQTWIQEKYVSCLEIFDQYDHLGKPEEGLRFLVESHKYDSTRVECIYRLVKHYCINGQPEVAYAYYTLIQDFFENKYDPGVLGDKLFAKMVEYHFYLPYYMVIAAERANKLNTAAKMFEIIIKLGYVAPEWWMRNIMFNLQFCMSHLPKTVPFLQGFLGYLDQCRSQGVKFEPVQLQVLGRMIDLYKPVLMARPEVSAMPLKKALDGSPVRVMLTMTSCKRFDLFEQTVGSLLNTWKDLNKVDYFFCVDDNSSQRDRTKMTTTFPFFDYYMKRKSEKGHRASMNIIYDKLKEVNPTYWIHMEDDWLFFQADNYVQKSIDFLEKYEGREIHQILYNRHYGETYDCWDTNGGTPLEPGFLLHLKSDAIPGRNCGYWPHYSFRPSMIRTKVILDLGNYDSPNTFFERDYADKYFAKGYLSAFFNTICSLHIGKLTSDKKGTNAYTLNETGQFGAKTTKVNSTYVVNLLRRTDRKEATEIMLEKAGFQENEYEFFEAVDGKELVLTDEINQLFLGNDFGSRRGFIGCAMSHYALWKQLLDDKDNEYYTIFEDDNTVADDFKAKLESVKSDLVSKDIVFLGYTTRDPHIRRAVKETPIVPLDLSKYVGGTFGYIVTKSGAKTLVDYIAKHGIKHGIDYLMKITPNMRHYNVQPHIVFSEWIMSDAKQGDSDIQVDTSSLPIVVKVNRDDWIFYEGMDSGGSDTHSVGIKPVNELMSEATKAKSAAFNTLGYLKSQLSYPFRSTPYISQRGSGIYVKKEYISQYSKNWISPVLGGGIGNCLFKIGAALGIAEHLGREVVFYNPPEGTSSDICYKLFPNIRVVNKADDDKIQVFSEDKLDFYNFNTLTGVDASSNLVVEGCRQSPRYLASSGLHITLSSEASKELYSTYGINTNEEKLRTWFIHVRLGDYRFHTFLNHITMETYYALVLNKIPLDTNIILFSDEPDKAAGLLRSYSNREFKICRESDELVTLDLMSQCWGGAIVPNSTFSWWGAYFARQATTQPSSFVAYYPKFWTTTVPDNKNNCNPSWGISIDNIRPGIPSLNDWTFYEGMDSGGCDIKHSSPGDINTLMQEASNQPDCVGFNTLGFLKSRIRFPLSKSPWLNSPHGIYVKKTYKPTTRVKMLCNWCSSEELCKEWLKMTKGAYRWNNIEITWTDYEIDYYVIINKPRAGDKYEANKTIIFHMEPWCSEPQQNWGVKSWGEWAKPDPAKFLQVRSHDKFLNTAFWQVSWTYTDFKTREINKSTDLQGIVSSICSSKYYDPGHKKRIDFLKYIESRMAEKDAVKVHVFNEDNEHGFATYQGKARPFVDKENGLIPYKYYFMCENNAEANFVTEKLWEPILCEALCFYWGCPNVTDHVDPMAYVVLDMNDFEAAYNTMNAAIKMNLWEERLPYIKAAKQRILEEQGFFPLLEQALKPKTVCFVHSCHLAEAGTGKLDIILESVCAVKELECITINNIGLPLDADKYLRLDARIKVIESSCDTSLFELPTLKLISEYSKANPKAKVLYVHTKGISYSKEDPRYINGLDWINYMLHFVCKKADNCLRLLDTHDVAGCNYSKHPYHHFSGNFWWATSAHLKGLSLESLVDKMSAEWWLMNEYNTRPMRVANLWSSGKNHFTERYPVEEYNNSQPSFHILIACGGRKTLKSLLDSVIGQLNKFDAITIVFDGENARDNSGYSNSWITGCECSIFTIDQTPNLGANIGSEPVRTKYQSQLEKITSFVVHADDDDIYLPGAFDKLREQCTDTDTLYIAKFDNADNLNDIVPRCNKIEYCNIGTPCGIIPYTYRDLATWGNHRGGDYTYYNSLQHKVKNVVWLDTIIYRVMSIGHGIIN